MSIGLRHLAIAGIAIIAMSSAAALPAASNPVEPASQAAPVFMQARVTSFHEEAGDKFYVRLKLMPRFPYASQTFRVTDRSLVAGLAPGSWVTFTSSRVNGENTLTAIQPSQRRH
jgi:Cu/Ag efflux protein CusF